MSSPRPRSIPVERDDQLEVTVVNLGDGPDGVAKLGDYIVFVPGVLPGETAWVRITSAARKFARAELLSVRRQSPERQAPRCPHFLDCGGCDRQHQPYAAQLLDKQARLQRTVDHALGDAAPAVAETRPARPPYGQRHKVVLHLRNHARLGLEGCFHRRRSPELVSITECPASDPLAWDLAERTVELLRRLRLGAWDPDFAQRDLLRSVLVRATTLGEAHLLLVAREPEIPGLATIVPELHAAGATSISVNGNAGEFSQLLGPETRLISGPRRICERFGGIEYLISAEAFFQTSPQAAEDLVGEVVRWLEPGPRDHVLDLYCGTGLLTLPLARLAGSAHGVERNRSAVRDAEAAAKQNHLTNVQFQIGEAAACLDAVRRGALPRPRLVAMDPPRTGLEPGVVEALRELRPERLAYVSCEPQTLQRDLAALQNAGFATEAVLPFDMFPQTCHVESLACLRLVR